MKKPSAFTVFAAALLFFSIGAAYSQEALKSTEEEYFDFLSLLGLTERPALNYRTLSDSVWAIKETDTGNTTTEDSDTEANADSKAETINRPEKTPHPWQNNNLGTKKTLWKSNSENTNWFTNDLNRSVALKIYGPEWFNSYNTAAPYGQNDGALWQGKGYNTSLTAGVRLEAFGFEVTVKPQVAFSQNRDFEIMKSHSDSEYGYFWGYDKKNNGVDLPQRFGDEAFYYFDWGDTEVRYTWKNLTLGFGTQAIWLGPAQVNAILHSNNAPTYPKFDAGLRRTEIHIPWLNWYIGDIEARIWTGKLTESDYYDSDESNDNNMIHGLALAYAPSFVPGLTLFANRTCLVKWDWENLKYILPVEANTHVGEQGAGEDQKMSFGADWIFAPVGLEIYGELGLDDFLQGGMIKGLIRYPFDTMTITAGLRKYIKFSDTLSGSISFEYINAELPRNKIGPRQQYAFNMHYQITQGYTNRGQCIGSVFGVGGNEQILTFDLYYPKGLVKFTLARNNPDNTYMYWQGKNLNNLYKANFIAGINSLHYVTSSFSVSGGLTYNWILNPFYDTKENSEDIYNFVFTLGLKYSL